MFVIWQRFYVVVAGLLLMAACSHAVESITITEEQLNEQMQAQYLEPRLLHLELALGASAQLYITDVSIELQGEGGVQFNVTGDFDLEFGGAALTDPVPFSLIALGSLGFDPEQSALYPWQLDVDKVTVETDIAALHLPLEEVLGVRVAQAIEELSVYHIPDEVLPSTGHVVELAIDSGKLRLLFGKIPVN